MQTIQVALAAAVVHGLASPAAAQGVIATGSGRAGATVALVVTLIGVVTGGFALRSAKRDPAGKARDGAIVALAVGVIGTALAALHLLTSGGAVGTGNGRGGAIVALVLGAIGMVLGRLALMRSRRTG